MLVELKLLGGLAFRIIVYRTAMNGSAEVCSMYMTRMTGIERQVTGALLRLSGLEDAKSGAIERALMVKEIIFFSCSDVTAWCTLQFPVSLHRTVEYGCFMTPHYLLNLVHAYMCNKPYPATEFTMKNLKTLEVNHPNSTAYSALQSFKLTIAYPNHS